MTASRRWRGRRGGLVLLALLAAAPALAEDGEEDRRFEVPPSLPESINGIVRPEERPPVERIDRIRDIFAAVQACWRPPRDGGYTGQEITVRLGFNSTGVVLGKPRVTFYKPGGDASDREAFTRSIAAAFERCTPLPFTKRLGAAVAGRPFTFRFVDSRAL